MKIRVYDNRGRERFLSAGQTAPAGWFRDGQPPVELTESATVVECRGEGNPYDQDSRETVYLRLVTASETSAAVAAEAAEAAGRAEAVRLNGMLAAAGVLPTTAEVVWGGYLCGDEPALRLTGRQAPITEAEVRQAITGWLGWQAQDQAKQAAEALVARRQTSVKDFAAKAGVVCGTMVTWQGAYVSHEDSFGGLAGGDYDSGESWVWEPWAATILADTPGDAPEISAACAAWQTATEEAAQAVRESKAREIKAAKEAELLAAGLRAEDIKLAMDATAEESRLRDIARIRRNWRAINSRSWRARSARNGGRSSYHADALRLLERIETAQAKAAQLRAVRESRERDEDFERRTRAEQAAQAAKEENKARFLTGSAWGALDSLSSGNR
jgi:hypothetical protein